MNKIILYTTHCPKCEILKEKLDNKNMGRSDLGWLQSIFHFSFANYYNQDNMNFGVLRVVNDDLVKSNTGFDLNCFVCDGYDSESQIRMDLLLCRYQKIITKESMVY